MKRSLEPLTLLMSLFFTIGAGAVVAADLAACGGRPPEAPTYGRHEFDSVADGFTTGLKTDPFFDASADRAEILGHRWEVIGKVSAELSAPDRAAHLRWLYMLMLDTVGMFDATVDAIERDALRESAELYARRARAELKGSLPPDFEALRYQANLRFLAAMTWVLAREIPDATCLSDLQFAASHDGDYRSAAAVLLEHGPEEDSYAKGLDAFAREDFTGSAALFGTHLVRFPKDVEARRWRGLALLRGGDPAAALEEFVACIRQSPTDAISIEDRGHALYRLGRTGDAIAAWEAAAKLSSGRAATLRRYVHAARSGG